MKTRFKLGIGLLGAALVGGGVWFLLLRPSARLGVRKPPSRSRDVLALATFNVGGLFDPEDDPALRGDYDDVPSSQEHLLVIAEAIDRIDADILVLENVESEAAVRWFADTYLGDLDYEYILSLDVGHPKGIENAVLSRYPIEESQVWPTLKLKGTHPKTIDGKHNTYSGKTFQFRRSPLMVQVALPGQDIETTLTLFVVEHKGGDKYDYWREAEAKAIMKLAQNIGMTRPIVVLGSFHADPSSPLLGLYHDGGFTDALGLSGETDRWATEASGDRTDYILANQIALADLDSQKGFVLGGKLAEIEDETIHLPVVIGIRIGDN